MFDSLVCSSHSPDAQRVPGGLVSQGDCPEREQCSEQTRLGVLNVPVLLVRRAQCLAEWTIPGFIMDRIGLCPRWHLCLTLCSLNSISSPVQWVPISGLSGSAGIDKTAALKSLLCEGNIVRPLRAPQPLLKW